MNEYDNIKTNKQIHACSPRSCVHVCMCVWVYLNTCIKHLQNFHVLNNNDYCTITEVSKCNFMLISSLRMFLETILVLMIRVYVHLYMYVCPYMHVCMYVNVCIFNFLMCEKTVLPLEILRKRFI